MISLHHPSSTAPARTVRGVIAAALFALPTLAFPVLALATPGPGPGEPFGGDDGGCVPIRSELKRCADTASKACSLLETAVGKCHASLAAARYAEVILTSA